MKKLVLSFILVGGAALFSGALDAAEQYIYKWKDSQGMVHYTERPPAPGITFEKVRRTADKGQPSSSFKPAAQDKAQQKEETDDTYSSWKRENCKIATQNLDILQNAKRISADDGQGGILTDEQKAEKIEKMKAQRDKYCQGAEAEENN